MEASDVQDVWEIMPDLRSGTLQSKTAQGQFTPYALTRLRRKPTDLDQNGPGGAILKVRTTIWQAWQVDLDAVSAPAPKIGDKIVESGRTWIVDRPVKYSLIRQVYDCPCVEAVA